MSNLYAAHNEWMTRPADERFWSLDDLMARSREERQASIESRTTIGDIRAESVQIAGYDSPDLRLVAGGGDALSLTHWSFGQLCSAADAPANYLRRLPADLAAVNLNHGLRRMGTDQKLQFLTNVEAGRVRSITRDYARLWNDDLITALTPALDLGWRVPPARPGVDDPRARPATEADILPDQGKFGLSVKLGDTIAPAGVYCGDRDLFVFLVHPDRVIDDGNSGMMRGVFLWNSEVGAGSFKVRTFYLENVCGNHIVWGASHVREVKVRHRGDRILTAEREMVAQLREYADAPASVDEEMIREARLHILGIDREKTIERVGGIKSLGLTRKEIGEAYESAIGWETAAKCPPMTAWGFVHGLTRLSQREPHADQRNRMDRAGGKILALAV